MNKTLSKEHRDLEDITFLPCFEYKDVKSTEWRNLAKNKKINTRFFYDYLRYQVPLTSETPATGVKSGDYIKNITAEKPITKQDYRNILVSQIKNLTRTKAFHLSGGLDSGLLVLLAGKYGGISNSIAVSCETLGTGSTDELYIAKRIAETADIEFKIFDFTKIDIFKAGQEFIRLGPGYPLAHPSHLTRFLIDKELSKTAYKTVVTGRGPDEVLGGYIWHAPEFSSFEAHHQRIQVTTVEMLDSLFTKKIKSRAFENYKKHFKNSYNLDTRMQYDLLTILKHWNIIDSSFSRGLGLHYKSPFLHPDLIAGSLGLPEKERTFTPPHGKKFLIETFKDIYPSFMLEIPKRGLSFDMRAYFKQYNYQEILDKIYNNFTYNTKTFNKKTVEDILDSTLKGKQNFGWQLWGLYLIGLTAQTMEENYYG